MEYAWFNNVETKPGIGYPKDWENQERWKGGWERKANGKLVPKQGGRWAVLAKIFANPHLPEIDDYYEPFTFDYENLQTASELGRDPRRRVRQAQQGLQLRSRAEGHLRPVRKHLHDVPAAPVRALPQPDLRGVVPLRFDLQARGRRHRPDRPGQVSRLADVRVRLPVQEDLLQLGFGQGREMHVLLPAHRGRPADRVLGNLRWPHPLSRCTAVRRRSHQRGRRHGKPAGPLRGATRCLPRSVRSGNPAPGAG